MKCRHCNKNISIEFLDLGCAPASNAYISKQNLNLKESILPLKVLVCDYCWLVQTQDFEKAENLFNSDYAYFSSTSESFLKHAEDYSKNIIDKLKLNDRSHVIEIASNDGYLLKNFVHHKIPCLGIEPTSSTANKAKSIGIDTLEVFFNSNIADLLVNQGLAADLIIGNNVFAHVPDINDFTLGIKKLLKFDGVINLEFPHLLKTIKGKQFDQIYHEHFSYLSLISVQRIFEKYNLKIWNVENLDTHGGSIRIYASHQENNNFKINSSVKNIIDEEIKFGLTEINTYTEFQKSAYEIRNNLIKFLDQVKKKGKKIIAYGAAAKGNTLLNFSNIKSNYIDYVCDAALSKQGKFMPGSKIPIVDPSILDSDRFDYIFILPWNIKDEILEKYDYLKKKGVKFFTAIPELKIYE